jgi:hypothetical protein
MYRLYETGSSVRILTMVIIFTGRYLFILFKRRSFYQKWRMHLSPAVCGT